MIITIERIKSTTPSSMSITGTFVVNSIILKLITSSVLCFLYGFFWEEIQEITSAILAFVPIVTFVAIDYAVGFNDLEVKVAGFKITQLDTVRLYMTAIGTPTIGILSMWATSTFQCRRIVGAGDILLSMYQTRIRLQSYMRLDLQLLIILGLLGFGIGTSTSGKETNGSTKYIVVSVMVIFAILKWIIGKIAIQKELKGMVALFVSLATLGNLWIPVQVTSGIKF